MIGQHTAITVFLLFASIITSALACFAYRHRRQTGAGEFAALMIAFTIYSFGYAFELSSNFLKQVLFWNKVEYLGIAMIPLFWVMLVSNFVGISRPLKSRIFFFLGALSLLVLVANFTNDFHHLYYTQVTIWPGVPIPIITYTAGPLELVYLTYLYSAVFGGNILLLLALTKTAKLYRRQIYTVICGSLLTWLGSIIYLFGFTPNQLDPSPFAFTVTGLVLAWGVFRHQLFKLSPIARGIVFETMRDGVLILDLQNRMIDYNPAAQNMFGELTHAAIGRDIASIIDNNDFRNQIISNKEHCEFAIAGKDHIQWIDSQLSWILSNSGTLAGKLVILDDITLEREAQSYLIQAERLTVHGQLVSNVVHEMSTPLAAIKATAENVDRTLESLMFQMDNVMSGLEDWGKDLWLEILEKKPFSTLQSSMDGDEAFRKLLPVLEERNLAPAYDIARSFAFLGIADRFTSFIPMLEDEEGRVRLKFVLEIASQCQKLAELLREEEQAADIIHALKNYSHPSGI